MVQHGFWWELFSWLKTATFLLCSHKENHPHQQCDLEKGDSEVPFAGPWWTHQKPQWEQEPVIVRLLCKELPISGDERTSHRSSSSLSPPSPPSPSWEPDPAEVRSSNWQSRPRREYPSAQRGGFPYLSWQNISFLGWPLGRLPQVLRWIP